MALSIWNDDFFTRPFDLTPFNTKSNSLTKDFMPLMGTDLIESDTNYTVHVDLPGVNAEDLDISVSGNDLVMKAERKYVHEEKNDKVHSMERSYGTVQRRIRLPKDADMDNAATNMKNGVLTVTIPKKAGMKDGSRKLEVNIEK